MINKFLLILFLLLTTLFSFGQEYFGVYFKSKEVGKEFRTGIDVTKKGLIDYENSFSIEFDLSYRSKPHRYGHVIQLKEMGNQNHLDIICKIEEDNPSIILVQNKKTPLITLALSADHSDLNNYWHKIKISFSKATNEIELHFDNYSGKANINLPQQSEYALIFGIVNNYGFETVEIPPISIKEIKISSNNQLEYYWPLNQFEGNSEKDLIHKKQLEIINPDWKINHHATWKKETNMPIESTFIPQVAFDSVSEILYFLTSEAKIIKYHLNTNEIETIYYTGNPLFEESQQLIIDKKGNLSTYSFNKPGISIFNKKTNAWDSKEPFVCDLPHYWHHNTLFHPKTGQLIVLNGYGFYTFKNTIQTYNTKTKYWNTLNFSGDTIHPRYLSSLGAGADKNINFLFGGIGNESGKQILGVNFYYDLYSLNLSTNKIKKLWEVDASLMNCDYTPVNSLIVDDKNKCFYTLLFPHEQYNTYLRVVKLSLDKPEINWIGDSIPYLFKDTESFADLFFWKSRNSLIALTLHKENDAQFILDLFTLKNPPIDSEYLFLNETKSYVLEIILGICCLIIIIVSGIYFWFSKNKTNKKQALFFKENIAITDVEPICFQKINSVFLFGGFQVFDKNGTDISYRFSPTLKDLFLLILIYTTEKEKGISSLKIQEFLWPDKSEEKAKNNRGVNIKKLREIIEDIDGIEIDYQNTYWKLQLSNTVFCDYIYVFNQIKKFKNSNTILHENISTLISLLKKGGFLMNTSSEWLDNIRGKVSHRIVEFLENQANIFCESKDFSNTIELSNIIFAFDQINEVALKNKVKSLFAQGHHSLSLNTYNNFCKLYNELYNEEYAIPLKKIAK